MATWFQAQSDTMFEVQVVRLPLVHHEGIPLWLGQPVLGQALVDGWLQVGDLQAGTYYYKLRLPK